MVRARLLLSSLSPLMAILAARLWNDHRVAAWALVALAALSVASLVLFLRTRSSLMPQTFVVATAKDESDQIPAYVVTYVLPFVTLQVTQRAELVAYVLLALVLAVLVLQTDLVYVQPLLLMIGWHLYRVEVRHGLQPMTLVSGSRLEAGVKVSTVGLAGTVARVVKTSDEE